MYDMLYIHLQITKRRMRYNPEKIVTHGCKLHDMCKPDHLSPII